MGRLVCCENKKSKQRKPDQIKTISPSFLTFINFMSEQATIERARDDKRAGKSPSTQAGEFVREEFHHIREGKHGARSAKQAITIGLSKARRAGVRLPPPKKGRASNDVRRHAERDY